MQALFIILLSLFSVNSYARSCADEAGNLSLGIKLLGRLTNLLEEKAADPCSTEADSWEEERDAKIKITKIIKNDLRTKKKTSSSYFWSLDGPSMKDEISESELCQLVDKKANEYGSSSCIDSRVSGRMQRTDLAGMSFPEACKKFLPQLKKAREDCQKSANRVVEREPPGEEIAPAEDPVVIRRVVVPKKQVDPTGSSGRARIRFSSGASAQ
jgi:hypothetical protein